MPPLGIASGLAAVVAVPGGFTSRALLRYCLLVLFRTRRFHWQRDHRKVFPSTRSALYPAGLENQGPVPTSGTPVTPASPSLWGCHVATSKKTRGRLGCRARLDCRV